MDRTRFVYNSIMNYNILVIIIYTCQILATYGLPNIELNTVRQQFEAVESSLKQLEKIFSLSPEESNERLECKISNVEITNLKLRIEEIISQASNTINRNSSETNLNYTDNCKELTKTVLWGIQQIENGLIFSALVGKSNSEISKWIHAYENFYDIYLKQSDKVKESLSRENQFKMERLETHLKNLRKSFMIELESYEIPIVEKFVTEINIGNIQEATEHLNGVQINTMSKIIRKSFQNGVDKLKTFENIMNFIKKQSKIDKKISYEILYSEMVEYSTLEYLTLESSNMLENITANLCNLEIKLGKIQEAFEHFEHLKFISMSQIIHESYDLNNFENIMNLIKKQPYAEERNMSYATLSTELLDHYKLENLESIKINLCVLKILLGETSEAGKLFNELKTISLEKILKKTHKLYDNAEDLKNILAFIESQEGSYCNILKATKIIITSAIKHWEWPAFFSVDDIAVMGLYSRDFLNYSSCINETQDFWVEIILSNRGLAYHIWNHRFREGATPNVTAEDTNKYFDNIIGPSIQKALKVENILTNKFEDIFVQSVGLSLLDARSSQLLVVTLSTIFEKLKKQNFINNQNQISTLAIYLKQFMEQPEYEKLSEEYKNITENIKWNLPIWAQKMFWQGDKCKLKNRYWGEYLYACGQCKNYSDNRPVFVGTPEIEAESLWIIDNQFTIQNMQTKEFLFAATEKPDSWIKFVNRRPVFTRKDELPLDYSWTIKQASYETDITIEKDGEYLYVDGNDEWNKLGRRVFTSLTGKYGRPYENEWELICE